MDLKKLSKILIYIGIAIVIASLLWWKSAYDVAIQMAGYDNLASCIFTSGGFKCQGSYNPLVIYFGIVMFIAGIIMSFILKPQNNKSAEPEKTEENIEVEAKESSKEKNKSTINDTLGL
jgi:ABC-type multidrug transport system permease subunit